MGIPKELIRTDAILVLVPNRIDGLVCEVEKPCLFRQRDSANWPGYLFDEDDVTLGDLSEGSATVSTKARLYGLVTIQDEGEKRLREDGDVKAYRAVRLKRAGQIARPEAISINSLQNLIEVDAHSLFLPSTASVSTSTRSAWQKPVNLFLRSYILPQSWS